MGTSTTTSFNLDFMEIAEEAWERAGREMRSGYDLRTARRSMNLLTIEWANRGLNMWTINEGSIDLTAGTSQYVLTEDTNPNAENTVDVIEHFIRENSGNTSTQSDTSLNRISVSTYAAIPNKLATGKPLQVFVERLGGKNANSIILNLWPVPDKTYKLGYFSIRRIQDASSSDPTKNNPDISYRFLPCLVAGLAYYIAMKVPELMPRVQMLKQEYEEQYAMAASEDREKTSARFVPSIGYH